MSISKLSQVISVFRASKIGYNRTEHPVEGKFKWREGKIRHFPSIFRILSPFCIRNDSKQNCWMRISQEDFRKAIWGSTGCYKSGQFLSSPESVQSLQWHARARAHTHTHTHLLDNFPTGNVPTPLGKATVQCWMHVLHNFTYSPISLKDSGLLAYDNAPLGAFLDVSEKESPSLSKI
jgi:hypothetical protein